MGQREALEAVVTVLTGLGRIEQIDAARVEVARGLADAVDNDPQAAALWREYRSALGEMVPDGHADDPGIDIVAQLQAKGQRSTGS
jgi:hypothetical protein